MTTKHEAPDTPQVAHYEIGSSGFSDRLCRAMRAKGTPLMVGLDPRWEQLPSQLRRVNSCDSDFKRMATDYCVFCRSIIDVVADLVPAIKPQAAFFEQLGPEGLIALAEVVDYACSKGLLVIMDAKRGDIGSTAEAYAHAYLGTKPKSAWGCDALTVNPYLGGDSLQPFVDIAKQNQAGIFVLVKTSNPGSRQLQDLMTDGSTLFQKVAKMVQQLAAASSGESGYGAVGAVAGATYPEQLADLRQQMPNALLLVPGYGAQGGSAADIASAFRDDGLGAVINSSRGIIFAYSNPRYDGISDWMAAVERATIDSIAEIAAETSAGKLQR
jgi:orotidine-5'-phosphate decarboxylase